MTPALPSLEHPLAGGGMSSTSAAYLLSDKYKQVYYFLFYGLFRYYG